MAFFKLLPTKTDCGIDWLLRCEENGDSNWFFVDRARWKLRSPPDVENFACAALQGNAFLLRKS